MFVRTLIAASVVMAASGCASIMNGQDQTVSIQSDPPGATVKVTNKAGVDIHTGTTPTTLVLKRGAGYAQAERYTVNLAKPGHTPKEIVVEGSMSGWYIGNLLFGGLIGIIIVDPLTGGMFTLPDNVSAKLDPNVAPKAENAGDKISILTPEHVPVEVMKQATLVGYIK